MKIAILTNEYPPHVYGGAGVHVKYLVQQLAGLDCDAVSIKVLCFGSQKMRQQNLQVQGVDPDLQYAARELHYPEFLHVLIREVAMTGSLGAADIIHCHTWYTHLAGCLLKQLVGGRLVLTTHSLEPHRPWKLEQLGAAYHASSWMERTAYENADGVIAVSRSMKEDVQKLYNVPAAKIRVIHNGIDIEEYRPQVNVDVLLRHGINPGKPYILFVGRITRQKGIVHLINAIPHIRSSVQIVLCAGAADTRGLEQEISTRIEEARAKSANEILWIPQTVPKPDIINIYSAASIFICPSIYEPFGIINLEAMACGTPVVASAVGGIPEIVVPGETGLLVALDAAGPHDPEPREPELFSRDLASAIDALLQAPDTIERMRRKARARVEKLFSWKSVARRTLDFYRQLM
jgi:starch synthase